MQPATKTTINFTTIALPFSNSLDYSFVSKLFDLASENGITSKIGYLSWCDDQNFELNWIETELHHYHCMEYLYKEPLFQVVDGLILLMDLNTHLFTLLQHPNSFYSFILAQILKVVKENSLHFMVYLNGFENYSTLLHPNHVNEYVLKLQHLAQLCEISLDQIILGSIALNIGGMSASMLDKLSQIYVKLELKNTSDCRSKSFLKGLSRKTPFRETLLKKITELLTKSSSYTKQNRMLKYFGDLPNEILSVMNEKIQNNIMDTSNTKSDDELFLYAFSLIPHPEKKRRYLSLCKVLYGKARPGTMVTILMINSKGKVEKISKAIQNIAIRRVTTSGTRLEGTNSSSIPFYDHYLSHNNNHEHSEFVSRGSICLVAGLDNYIVKHALLFTLNFDWKSTSMNEPSNSSRLPPSSPPPPQQIPSIHDDESIDFAFECPLLLQPIEQQLSDYIMTEIIRELNTISFRISYENEDGILIIQCTNLYLLLEFEKKLQELFQELELVVVWANHTTSPHSPLKGSTSIAIRETCSAPSPTLLAKSPNKHVRLYVRTEPLTELDRIRLALSSCQEGVFNAKKKVFKFKGNVLIEATKGVQYVNEIIDSTFRAFMTVMKEGVLCESPVVNMKYYLEDATLVSDAIHRGAGQVSVKTLCENFIHFHTKWIHNSTRHI